MRTTACLRHAKGELSVQLSGSDAEGFVVHLTRAEINIVANCLNEVAHGISVPEFETRVGATLEDIEQLLSQMPR
jgi:hypothetical protein